MTFAAKVNGGTGAGWRKVNEPGIDKCQCGGFISQDRKANGATQCVRCEAEHGRSVTVIRRLIARFLCWRYGHVDQEIVKYTDQGSIVGDGCLRCGRGTVVEHRVRQYPRLRT